MAEPWKCPDCQRWIAPDVEEHDCPMSDLIDALIRERFGFPRRRRSNKKKDG
jgi:hypothetical protein